VRRSAWTHPFAEYTELAPTRGRTERLLIVCHGGYGDRDSLLTQFGPLRGFLDSVGRLGWTSVLPSLGQHWGAPSSRFTIRRIVEAYRGAYGTQHTVVWGWSMGALAAMNYAADRVDPTLRGVIASGPALNLAHCYTTVQGGIYAPEIEAAYGFSGYDELAAATDGSDPVLRNSFAYRDLRYRIYVSPDDGVIDIPNHAQPMLARLSEATEAQIELGSGNHFLPGAYGFDDPSDIEAFLDRCTTPAAPAPPPPAPLPEATTIIYDGGSA
jgi:pimeloyl-ACP methyl ester carboxylesterase